MSTKQTLANVTLTLASLALVFGVLVIVEFLVRQTTDVGRLGTNTDLFVNNAYGESIGNAPDTTTFAFGIEVYIDGLGFRTGSSSTAKIPATSGKGTAVPDKASALPTRSRAPAKRVTTQY